MGMHKKTASCPVRTRLNSTMLHNHPHPRWRTVLHGALSELPFAKQVMLERVLLFTTNSPLATAVPPMPSVLYRRPLR